jgi:AefR-like transcriptional repressor, C-terminal domain
MTMILATVVSAMHGVMMQATQHKPELPRQFYHSVVAASLETSATTLSIAGQRGELVCQGPSRAAIQFIALIQCTYRYQLEIGVEASFIQDDFEAYVSDCVTLFLRSHRSKV